MLYLLALPSASLFLNKVASQGAALAFLRLIQRTYYTASVDDALLAKYVAEFQLKVSPEPGPMQEADG
jgi:hypothetical protein